MTEEPMQPASAATTDALAGLDQGHAATACTEYGRTEQRWCDEDIVRLHWRLLQEIAELASPHAPLEDKLQTLAWIFCDPRQDARPFSFAYCVQLASCHPLSPIAYCGAADAESMRDWIRPQARAWLVATLARYPDWVARTVRLHPDWVLAQLERDPHWITAQLRSQQRQEDLFATS